MHVGPDSKPIIFNSGCSITVTPGRQDVVGELRPINKQMSGLDGTSDVEGEGIIEWIFRDDFGTYQVI